MIIPIQSLYGMGFNRKELCVNIAYTSCILDLTVIKFIMTIDKNN